MSRNFKQYRLVNIEIRNTQAEEKWRLDKCTEIERMTITDKLNTGKEIKENKVCSRRVGRRAISVGVRCTLNSLHYFRRVSVETSSVGPAGLLYPLSARDVGKENAMRYTWRAGFFSSDDARCISRASNTHVRPLGTRRPG